MLQPMLEVKPVCLAHGDSVPLQPQRKPRQHFRHLLTAAWVSTHMQGQRDVRRKPFEPAL